MLPVQTGTGTPSPDNIRPIYGHTAASLWRTGANVFGGEALKDGLLAAMSAAYLNDDGVSVHFAAANTATQAISKGAQFKPNTQYTFIITGKGSQSRLNMSVNYTNGDSDILPNLSTANTKETKIFVSDVGKTVASLSKRSSSGSTDIYFNECCVLEGVQTADDFVAYNGNTYNVDFGRTVWGGTLDFVSGTLTETWDEIASYAGETLPGAWLSDRDEYVPGGTPTTGAQVVYELATPVVTQVTAANVTTLQGVNNVWVYTAQST